MAGAAPQWMPEERDQRWNELVGGSGKPPSEFRDSLYFLQSGHFHRAAVDLKETSVTDANGRPRTEIAYYRKLDSVPDEDVARMVGMKVKSGIAWPKSARSRSITLIAVGVALVLLVALMLVFMYAPGVTSAQLLALGAGAIVALVVAAGAGMFMR